MDDSPLGCLLDIPCNQGNAIGAVGAPTLVKVHEFTKLLRQANRSATADLTEFYLSVEWDILAVPATR